MKPVLGHYRILERLGAGGMGEVYLAEDSKLGRKIALKILPPELAQSPERLQRFESEARAVAALNHPNIVTVHSVEEADGVHFITMELVRGKTLTASIHRTSLREFFDIAVPLADALSAAHQQGIVHRDLKPDNVMLTDERRVKILDFGLAKMRATGGDSDPAALSHLPTKSVTSPGMIVGTVAYMSPEQAEGKKVDPRSDIFSLGIILYQLLAGRHPFSGESAASVLSGILKDTPPLVSDVDPRVPHELSRIVRRCLSKGLTGRYQSSVDLRNDLEEVKSDFESGALERRSTLQATPAARGFARFLPWVLASIAASTVVATLVLSGGSDLPRRAVRRFVIQPPANAPLAANFDLSPDGSSIVFVAAGSLYLQPLDEFAPRPLPGTNGAFFAFFSPDGKWVGFKAEGKLKKIAVAGGEPVTLSDANDVPGASWGEDGNIVFAGVNGSLRQVSAEGGESKAVIEPQADQGELDLHSPQILPGGDGILFTRHDKAGRFGIEVHSKDTGRRKSLLDDAFAGRYAPTGHLVYAKGHSLYAAPFDLGRLSIGPSVLVVENVRAFPDDGRAAFRIANDGTLVYVPEPSRGGRSLVWVDRKGTEQSLPLSPRAFSNPRLSPDGTQLAVGIEDSNRQDIWVYDLERETEHRVTAEGINESPVWTPDGRTLTFTSDRDGIRNLYGKPADGSGTPERLAPSELRQWPGEWSPDGRSLVFVESDPTDNTSLMLLRKNGESRTEPFTQISPWQIKPRLSPDGSWLVYEKDGEVYLLRFPSPSGPRQISTGGGEEPVWARDGREIFYRLRDTMVAVTIETSPSMRTGRPQALFKNRYVGSSFSDAGSVFGASYDVAPDGRFLMIKPSEDETTPRPIYVVQGWSEELKRRVPTTDSAQ